MDFEFTKMHGLGNDFLVADDRAEAWDFDPEAVAMLCDRHFGVGGDGLILVREATRGDADLRMLYYNADGTTAEMCGNGIRCFAKFVADRGLISGETVRVETPVGVLDVAVFREDDSVVSAARVDMGEPVLDPKLIPVDLPGAQVFECEIDTSEGPVNITAISMGNPHAIVWVDDVDTAPVETLGPAIESATVFPRKTNVEFAQAMGGNRVRLRVWERGVGETLACGTGACATAVAATLSCRSGRDTVVELPGGELEIRWGNDNHAYMTGPADEVFTGVVSIADEG